MRGNETRVIGLALALVVIGIVLTLLTAIWVGIPVAIVGIVLLVLYVAGIGRRAARAQEPGP